jgi:hypothetical protein
MSSSHILALEECSSTSIMVQTLEIGRNVRFVNGAHEVIHKFAPKIASPSFCSIWPLLRKASGYWSRHSMRQPIPAHQLRLLRHTVVWKAGRHGLKQLASLNYKWIYWSRSSGYVFWDRTSGNTYNKCPTVCYSWKIIISFHWQQSSSVRGRYCIRHRCSGWLSQWIGCLTSLLPRTGHWPWSGSPHLFSHTGSGTW